MIREEKAEQIPSAMQAGGKFGMQTMNWSLYDLYTRRQITYAQALTESPDVEDLKRICQKEEDVVVGMKSKR